jgi:hypothetical protein
VRTLALFLVGVFVIACDSSNDYEACRYSAAFDDPRSARCPGSIFPNDEERSREILGFVYRGDAAAANATVRMDPRRPAGSSGPSYVPLTTVSDSGGFYRIKNVPFAYDLTVRVENDVLAYRDLSSRYFEPTLAEPALPRTWTSDVDVVILPPPRPGHVVTFVGSGDAIIAVNGDAGKGAVVAMREYTTVATIHAIEHPEGSLLDGATSYGRVDVNVIAGRRASAEVHLAPIDRFDEMTFKAPLPRGFALDGAIGIYIDFGPRTNLVQFAAVSPNVVVKLPVFSSPNGAYVSARAHRKGAVSETGLYPMPSRAGTIDLPFPEPPTLEAAGSGTDFVAAVGSGVIEHVLRPVKGTSGPTLHVITKEREGRLPDLEAFGLPRATGRWVWTARDFPKVTRTDKLLRLEWLIQPSATAEPTEIVVP